jgi:hypothetical protein
MVQHSAASKPGENTMNSIKLTLELTIREVFLPDGETYWAAFNAQGSKVAPWADSDSPEEVCKKLLA